MSGSDAQKASKTDEAALRAAAIRLNTRLLAFVCALVGGALLAFATALSLAFGGPNPGQYLSLLAVFFPGYAVSWSGMATGFVWGSVVGGVSGAVAYWSYARSLGGALGDQLLADGADDPVLRPPVIVLAGPQLGLALGLVMALQLVVTTNWLVLRGTADESVHAMLLDNYLPSYTVTPLGSIVGAAELFVVTFAGAMLVASVYNLVARWRHR